MSVKAVLRVVGEGRLAVKARRVAQQAMQTTDITGVSNFNQAIAWVSAARGYKMVGNRPTDMDRDVKPFQRGRIFDLQLTS